MEQISIQPAHTTGRSSGASVRPKAKRKYWSPEDAARFASLCERLTAAELCKEFPGRTKKAMWARARELKLTIGRSPIGGNNWRGRMPFPKHAHPFVRMLMVEANKRKLFLHELCEQAGISKSTADNWRYATTPHMGALIAALNVVGLDLAVVRIEERT
jgi:hypothetical protein